MEEMSKMERVEKEKKRLLAVYDGLEPNKYATCYSLICRAAFITVCMEDLEMQIMEDGWTEVYKNGENQFGKKKSAEGETFNTLTKNLLGITSKLLEHTPPEKRKETRLAAMMRE